MRYVKPSAPHLAFKSVHGHKSRLRLMPVRQAQSKSTCNHTEKKKKSKANKIINESIMTSAWAVQSIFSVRIYFLYFCPDKRPQNTGAASCPNDVEVCLNLREAHHRVKRQPTDKKT